jgi:heptosyltransferase-2
MHVAAATGTPVVGIFGASSEHHTPPLGPMAATVSLSLSCRPCFARHCPLGHKQCLETLEPDRVIASLSALLEKPSQ